MLIHNYIDIIWNVQYYIRTLLLKHVQSALRIVAVCKLKVS